MDGEQQRGNERCAGVAQQAPSQPVKQHCRSGVEQYARQMEAGRREAPQVIVEEVGERLNRPVVRRSRRTRQERSGEERPDACPPLDRRVIDNEVGVVPDEGVREGVQIDGQRDQRDGGVVPPSPRRWIAAVLGVNAGTPRSPRLRCS